MTEQCQNERRVRSASTEDRAPGWLRNVSFVDDCFGVWWLPRNEGLTSHRRGSGHSPKVLMLVSKHDTRSGPIRGRTNQWVEARPIVYAG
jgi:hypothetical protein